MEDTSDMDLDRSYDRDVRNNANPHATPAHVDTNTANDGSPMNWTPSKPTQTSLPAHTQSQQTAAKMPSNIQDSFTFHPITQNQQTAANMPSNIQTKKIFGPITSNKQYPTVYQIDAYQGSKFFAPVKSNKRPLTLPSASLIKPSHRTYKSSGYHAVPPPPVLRNDVKISVNQPEDPLKQRMKNISQHLIAKKRDGLRTFPRETLPLAPRKRLGDDISTLDDAEVSRRHSKDIPDVAESELDAYSETQSGTGVFLAKVRNGFHALFRAIVRADEIEEMSYVPSNPKSHKRRAIARTMPGAYPLDNIDLTQSSLTLFPSSSQTAGKSTQQSSNQQSAESSTQQTAESSTQQTEESSTHQTAEPSTHQTAESSTHQTAESSTHQTAESSSMKRKRSPTSNEEDLVTPKAKRVKEECTEATTGGLPSIKQKNRETRAAMALADKEQDDLVMHTSKKNVIPEKPRIKTRLPKGLPMRVPSVKKRYSQIRAAKALADKEKDDLVLHTPKKKVVVLDSSPVTIKLTGKTVFGSDSHSDEESQYSSEDLDTPFVKARFGEDKPHRKRITNTATQSIQTFTEDPIVISASSAAPKVTSPKGDSSTSQAHKVQKVVDLTQPDPAQNNAQVQFGSISGQHGHSQAGLQAYRESEERPSTASSTGSEGGEQSQDEQRDDLGDAEHPTAGTSKTSGHVSAQPAVSENDQKGPEPVELQSSSHQRMTAEKPTRIAPKGWDTPAKGPAPSTAGLEKHLGATKCGLKEGENLDLRGGRSPQAVEVLMSGPPVKQLGDLHLGDLQLSEGRKDLREVELERQRLAEAEAKRLADEASAQAKRREEEEKKAAEAAKAEGRRLLLSQGASGAQVAEVAAALARNPMEEVSRNFSIRDLGTLVPKTTWLNDSAVNKYLELLTKESNERAGYTEADKRAGKAPPYQCLLSNWWVSVSTQGIEKVLGWNRRSRLHEGRLLLVKGLFIPICHNSHWRLVVVSGTERTITYYDSLAGSPNPFVAKAQEWVKATLGPAYNDAEWRIVDGGDQRSPRQNNSDDCGVFTLQNARAVALGLEIRPDLYVTSTEGILHVRHLMAAQLLSGELAWE